MLPGATENAVVGHVWPAGSYLLTPVLGGSFSSCNFVCSVEQLYRNLCKFVLFRVTEVNAQSDPAFVTCNKRICAVWFLVTVMQQKECVCLLAH